MAKQKFKPLKWYLVGIVNEDIGLAVLARSPEEAINKIEVKLQRVAYVGGELEGSTCIREKHYKKPIPPKETRNKKGL